MPAFYGTFKKPKLLLCLDTMCFTCLDEYALRNERIRDLPVPGVWLPVQEGGLCKFDKNQHIKVKQTIERALAAAGGPMPCEMKMI
ncbi:hypothetical protein DPMN_179011 [Dreissena polymorpha]|uniref:Uncharacterized protein n=1 Tax=Dreissena polymorpha TaxID=45954 RepID=A0A9D4EBM7_DREPO|nr:hypothetical protein DPMN_179011 [Dreissena polymorpha]